jgi:DNA-binding transcriptional ArsR family regulator
MSQRNRKGGVGGGRDHAMVFAALGDETRLALVMRLSDGQRYSIAELSDFQRGYSEGSGRSVLTRQAITKHLRVLERARLVHGVRVGRENLFVLDPRPIVEMKNYLELVSREWDQALARLKAFVEE